MKKHLTILCLIFGYSVHAQSISEIKILVESFRQGIISLESEGDWSELFLHDSITWAMIKGGQTEIASNFKSPGFRLFSSDPISFYHFLERQDHNFEEKFYDLNISLSEPFATVEFLYTFHKDDTLRNWGKEYWSLLKVKGEWKISSVTWTEHLQSIELCPFENSKSFSLYEYKCPPCPFGCDNLIYHQPGACPVCNMTLQRVEESHYNGYSKTKLIIPSEDVELLAAYYLPKDTSKIKGAMVICHGSAQSDHEDVSYYTNLAIKMEMAVLAYDKRGAGLSTGVYESFTVGRSNEWFNLLSIDLENCYRWLSTRPELKDKKIGFFGGSQAGWIMPLAASRLEGIDFIISGEGTTVSAGEENYFSQLTGDGDEIGQHTIQQADLALKSWNGVKGFDPRDILENLQVPTLWIFGTNDPVIPVDASIRTLEKINNPNFDLLILENGDHNFMNTETGKRYELVEELKSWLDSLHSK